MMNLKASRNAGVTWFHGLVTREDRESLHRHKGAVVWLTGLSASGKSTIAHHLERRLHEMGVSTYVFDGDNVRHGLCGDLGFSPEDRSENIRRIGEVTWLFVEGGIIAITAFISPYEKDRDKVRSRVGEDRFLEIFVECPLSVCASRDYKGLYEKAKAGLIKEFTGISAPYEPPENPHLTIRSDQEGPKEAAERVINMLKQHQIIPEDTGCG